jgi:hypothetical protein
MKTRIGALGLLIAASVCHSAVAGFAFQGVNAPVLFIPPVGPPKSLPTFTVGSPPILFGLGPGPHIWRVRQNNQPFWPVPNGIPLIQDNTLSNAPFLTPAGVWGIWDPPPSQIVANQTIRVFEIFTGLDLNAAPVGTIDLSGLVSVEGYPNLSVSSFPTQVVMNKPIGLDPNVNIISNQFVGLVTGTIYPTTLQESTFATLDADIAALAPGTTNPYDSLFQGATGRVVISYADVPMGDVIGFAELVPEPATLLPCSLAVACVVAGRRLRRKAAVRSGA